MPYSPHREATPKGVPSTVLAVSGNARVTSITGVPTEFTQVAASVLLPPEEGYAGAFQGVVGSVLELEFVGNTGTTTKLTL